ncbi:hypothetical protein Rsub_11508 [Raphidocelis subcapitata]|uniref:Uncharacterized protein n=1 Tax=Raphidocelis subcapitata TaxID=307507 RepID=A0A2V0PMD4_9CHLO|nr:hypothetical protein Rsub_11508 [Raphidocelis subcapitata]|eukprot:GBF98517.1 hypothetical protein Rsub_11508 [Raphidocelis subcapitata]
MLSARAASHASASSSGRGPAQTRAGVVRARVLAAVPQAPARGGGGGAAGRGPVAAAATPQQAGGGSGGSGGGGGAPDRALEAAIDDILFSDEASSERPAFQRLWRKQNSAPDLFDPDWPAAVDDWDEFWGATATDERGLEDLMALERHNYTDDLDGDDGGDDDDDAADTDGAPEADPAVRLARAMALIAGLRDGAVREDVVQMLGPPREKDSSYANTYELPPERTTIEILNPDYDEVYLRAKAEKRMRRDALDAEWRRRQELVGCIPAPDYTRDVRLQYDHIVRENWTHEQIMDLIVGGGRYASVEQAEEAAVVLNPLIPVDFHNDYGVEAIPETEEYIRSIGRLMEDRDTLELGREVELGEADFVDPNLAFRDEENVAYMQAPPNQWQELLRSSVAADIGAVFGEQFLADQSLPDAGVVDATLARSRELAAAAAAWAAAGEGDEGGRGSGGEEDGEEA